MTDATDHIRVLSALLTNGEPVRLDQRLCVAAAGILRVDGTSIRLAPDPEGHVGTVGSDVVGARLEELQVRHGTGPGIEAQRTGDVVSEPYFDAELTVRWPGFARAAIGLGVAAVFAFPLQSGTVRVGALTAYRGTPGPLSATATRDGGIIGQVVASMALGTDDGNAYDAGGTGLGDLDLSLAVHQATGMVAAQLGVDVDEALLRIRGHAVGEDLPLNVVADAVLSRRLRFDRLPE